MTSLSLVISLLYLFLAVQRLFSGISLLTVRQSLRSLRWSHVAAGVTVLVLAKWLLRHFSSHYNSFDALLMFSKTGALVPSSKILLFLVAHVIYFGPIVWLFVFCWRPMARTAREQGAGLVLLLTMSLMLSLDTESRHAMHVFPIFVALLVKSQENRVWSRAFFGFFTVSSLLLAKFWLKINPINPPPGQPIEYMPPLYFMNHGPWMSSTMYLINATVVALCGALLWLFYRTQSQEITPEVA